MHLARAGKLDDPRDLQRDPRHRGRERVSKHYQKAKADIEKGGGFEAIDEAITQIARASSILRGPETTTDTLLEQLKAVR